MELPTSPEQIDTALELLHREAYGPNRPTRLTTGLTPDPRE